MAIWDKPVSGSPLAPYNDPTANWDAVKFHSDLQYLNDAISQQGITLTHQTVAGVTGTGYGAPGGMGTPPNGIIGNGQILAQDQTLYTHNLGYVPLFVAMWDGTPLYPGTVIFKDKPNRHYRFASAYATTTVIGIRNMGASSSSALPSHDFDYDVTIFRRPEKIDGAPLARLHANAAEPLIIGYGRITDEHVPLRRVGIGDTDTFKYPISRCVDARAGTIRSITLDGVTDFGAGFYNGSLISAQFINLAK
jgi:hypothetical protein